MMSYWSEEEESPQLLITTIWICLMLPPGSGWLNTQGEVTSPPYGQDKEVCMCFSYTGICLILQPPCARKRDTQNDTMALIYKYGDRSFHHSSFCFLTYMILTLSGLLLQTAWVMFHNQLQQTRYSILCIAQIQRVLEVQVSESIVPPFINQAASPFQGACLLTTSSPKAKCMLPFLSLTKNTKILLCSSRN